MNEDTYTIATGMLAVGDGHEIYYQTWGNPKARPIFSLHGGPGAGTSDKHKLSFDPKKHFVVFHDQRGCGKSLPYGKLEANSTDKLVEDIEALREHLGITDKVFVFGGSWGSTLALAYSVAHPERVEKLLIFGVYLGTKAETDYIQQGGLATHFPDSWQQYIDRVPADMRDNTVAFYYEKMQEPDSDDYVRSWLINESSASTIDPDVANTALSFTEIDDKARSTALLETHYFMSDCFMPDNYILDNAKKLENIPTVIVQGRFDHVCPPETAYKLAQKIGDACHLHFVPSGHAREAAMRETIRAYTWSIFE